MFNSEKIMGAEGIGLDVENEPQIGMMFDSENEAYDFYNMYGGLMGFSVRRDYAHRSRKDNKIITSRRFVCNKQGCRRKDKRDTNTKKPRAEKRTNCSARMGIVLLDNGQYLCYDFVKEHNHLLHLPESMHMMRSQRKWIQSARNMVVEDNKGREVEEDVPLDYAQRYNILLPKFLNLALIASKSAEGFALAIKFINELSKQLEDLKIDAPHQGVPSEGPSVKKAKGFEKREGHKVEMQGKEKEEVLTADSQASQELQTSASSNSLQWNPSDGSQEIVNNSSNSLVMGSFDHSQPFQFSSQASTTMMHHTQAKERNGGISQPSMCPPPNVIRLCGQVKENPLKSGELRAEVIPSKYQEARRLVGFSCTVMAEIR